MKKTGMYFMMNSHIFFVYEKGLLKRRGLERVEEGNTGGSINKFCAADCIFVCAVL